MNTIVLRHRPRKSSSGATFTIDLIGDGEIVDLVRDSIRALEHHPAKASRRSLTDMLAIIQKHNFQIKYTEHTTTEDGLEGWLFVLQG